MSLIAGKRLSRQQWDVLPMPDGIIAAVENMALKQDQPLVGPRGTTKFEWSPGIPIQDDDKPVITVEEAGAEDANEQNVEIDQDDRDDDYDPGEEEDADSSDTDGSEELEEHGDPQSDHEAPHYTTTAKLKTKWMTMKGGGTNESLMGTLQQTRNHSGFCRKKWTTQLQCRPPAHLQQENES